MLGPSLRMKKKWDGAIERAIESLYSNSAVITWRLQSTSAQTSVDSC